MQRETSLTPGSMLWRLIEAAIRAPSGDNCQPWRFVLQDQNTIDVHTVPERARSFFDFGGRGTLLSVGAVLENMRIQAAADGFTTDVSYLAEEQNGGPVAVVRLRPDPGVSISAARLAAMQRRTVNRRPFVPLRPAREKLAVLLAEPDAGIEVQIIAERRKIRQWARLIYLADRIRYSHPVIHEELFSKILFTSAMARERRMGLEIDRLGAGPAAEAIMRFLQPWERMKRLQRIGIERALANQSRFLGLTSGALVLLSVDQDNPVQWVRAGESMERLWVTAEEQGLCVHPMTVVLFLVQRFREEGMANFLPGHLPLLEEMEAALGELSGDRTGTMLFRLGSGWRMKNRSVRLPVEAFVDVDR